MVASSDSGWTKFREGLTPEIEEQDKFERELWLANPINPAYDPCHHAVVCPEEGNTSYYFVLTDFKARVWSQWMVSPFHIYSSTLDPSTHLRLF